MDKISENKSIEMLGQPETRKVQRIHGKALESGNQNLLSVTLQTINFNANNQGRLTFLCGLVNTKRQKVVKCPADRPSSDKPND